MIDRSSTKWLLKLNHIKFFNFGCWKRNLSSHQNLLLLSHTSCMQMIQCYFVNLLQRRLPISKGYLRYLKFSGQKFHWKKSNCLLPMGKKLNWFKELIQMVHEKINLQRMNQLSHVGRNCLIQHITNTMANFIMVCYVVPKVVLKQIIMQQTKFWWGKATNHYYSIIKWKNICKPKVMGGLRIWAMTTMNIGLFTELGWRIVSVPHSIPAKVIVTKYEKGKG